MHVDDHMYIDPVQPNLEQQNILSSTSIGRSTRSSSDSTEKEQNPPNTASEVNSPDYSLHTSETGNESALDPAHVSSSRGVSEPSRSKPAMSEAGRCYPQGSFCVTSVGREREWRELGGIPAVVPS
jgi:hypothetical protein